MMYDLQFECDEEYGNIEESDLYGLVEGFEDYDLTEEEQQEYNDYEELEDLKGGALLEMIRTCLSRLRWSVFDRRDEEGIADNIDHAESILKATQRYCLYNKSLRPYPDASPESPGANIGTLYQHIFPKMKGPRKALKRLHKLAKETIDVILAAEASAFSYIINNPDSLRSLYNFKASTSHSVTTEPLLLKPPSGPLAGSVNSVETGEASDDARRERMRVEGVDKKIKEMVEKLKRQKKQKLVRGFGPGKDIALPASWVEDRIRDEMIEDEKRHELLREIREVGVMSEVVAKVQNIELSEPLVKEEKRGISELVAKVQNFRASLVNEDQIWDLSELLREASEIGSLN
jgi:hypothetical protein